jgi:hypothetical protein
MASKRGSKKTGNVWQAGPEDAIRLAALRWFSLEIERMGIEIYASDKTKYKAIEKVLRQAMTAMNATRDRIAVGDPDECPDGYVLCKDGLCAPMCDGIAD